MITKIFPTAQMALCLCACIVYFWNKDIKMGCYWFFAACLTGSVTYL